MSSIAVVRWRPKGTFLLFESDGHRLRDIAIGPLDIDLALELLGRLGWPVDSGDHPHR